MRSFTICGPHQILPGAPNQEEWDGWGMWNVWGIEDTHTGFLWEDLMERDHWEDVGIDGNLILKYVFEILRFAIPVVQ